jgi:tripartite-type tricarboxylate transporter receptor subunit TctC
MFFSRRSFFYAMMALGLAFNPLAHAQQWPAKPITVIVPYPAGGNADSSARALSQALSTDLKQTVIVDNRPGASSIIGTELIARAPADGYTIGVVSDSHAINQVLGETPKGVELLGAKPRYDAVRDFMPIAGTIQIPLVMVVNPKLPAHTFKEVVQLSKTRSGLNFGTMGTGSPWFFHMHKMIDETGAMFVDVPYKGLAPATTDLIGGQIDVMVMPLHYAQQFIHAGKLLPIATLGTQRHPLLPDAPTLVESGYPNLVFSNYIFFVAPAGTPQAIVDKLGKTLNAELRTPEMKEKLINSGDPYPAEPADLSARLRRDIDGYGQIVQKLLK